MVAWYVLGNCDPTRDCFFVDNEGKPLPCLMVDGTRKSFPEDAHPREWPNVVCSGPKAIARVDSKWDSLGIGPLIESPSRRLLEIQFGDSAMVK